MANISFVGCTIFSPFNDGGFKFIDNGGHCNININDCSILNLTPRASAFIGNKYIINNNRMTYFVHTSINSFEGVGSNLTESIITNNNIFGFTSVMNKCSNNGVNGFIIINIDKNSIFDNNKITNFTNVPIIYFDETIKTFETTSGITASQTLTAQKSGKCIIKLHLTIPSGGNSGRLYVKLATTQRTTNVNLLAFQSNIPNNSTNQDFYIIDNLRKGEELKLDILQESGTNKTIYGTFTFNYS